MYLEKNFSAFGSSELKWFIDVPDFPVLPRKTRSFFVMQEAITYATCS